MEGRGLRLTGRGLVLVSNSKGATKMAEIKEQQGITPAHLKVCVVQVLRDMVTSRVMHLAKNGNPVDKHVILEDMSGISISINLPIRTIVVISPEELEEAWEHATNDIPY